MAKVKYTALMADARGKLNGSVLSKNRGGAYMRTKVTPSNTNTVAQLQARARLSQYAQGWKALTDDQRTAWLNAVNDWTTTDIFGDINRPSGNSLYIKLNAIIIQAGGTPITTPPSIFGTTGSAAIYTAVDVTKPTTAEYEATFEPATVPANNAIVVFATRQLSKGVSFVKSEYRYLTTIPAAETSPYDLSSYYIAKFGTPVAGAAAFFKFFSVNKVSGKMTQAGAKKAIDS